MVVLETTMTLGEKAVKKMENNFSIHIVSQLKV